MQQQHSIVLFDGVCHYCNGLVNRCIKLDKHDRFRFTPLQSDTGKKMRAQYGIAESIDSLVLIDNGKYYTYSAAALRICRRLGFPWSIFWVLIMVPPLLRDGVYHWVSRNRYKWFGRRDSCMIPDAQVRSKFLL